MPHQRNKGPQLWLTNVSKTYDVSLGDLRLTIRKGKSINILDSRHYHYTLEEIEKSLREGSLYKKREVIKIRKVEPEKTRKALMISGKPVVQKPLRSVVQIEEKFYEDLDILNEDLTEEQFVEENADADFQDHKPSLAVDKSFDDFDDD